MEDVSFNLPYYRIMSYNQGDRKEQYKGARGKIRETIVSLFP